MSLAAYIAITHCPHVRGRAKLIAYQLAEHADEGGRCYPSIKRMAVRLGYSTRNVQLGVRAFELTGYLTVERNRGKLNLYRMDLERMRSDSPDSNPTNKRSLANKGSLANNGSQSDEGKFTRPAKECSVEPVITSKESRPLARARVPRAALTNPNDLHNGRPRKDWDRHVRAYREAVDRGAQPFWHPFWGPVPTEPYCHCPIDILELYRFERGQR